MPAVTPPYRPLYGHGAPQGSAVQGAIYFDIDANYAPYTFNNGAWNNFAPILLGAGVPAFIAKAGTLYSRNDAAGVYASTPTLAAATVVQEAHVSAHSAPTHVTFGAPVTAGNLLLNFLGASSPMDADVDLSKWTILDTGNQGGGIDALVAYRYADGTEGTTPPNLCTAGNPFWGITCAEIGGVTGNINTDLHLHTFDHASVTFNTTTPQNTDKANELCLLTLMQYDGTANIANPAGWTIVDQWNDGAANYGAMLLSKQTPGSGTNVGNATFTRTAGASGPGFASTIIFEPGLVAGWTLIGP